MGVATGVDVVAFGALVVGAGVVLGAVVVAVAFGAGAVVDGTFRALTEVFDGAVVAGAAGAVVTVVGAAGGFGAALATTGRGALVVGAVVGSAVGCQDGSWVASTDDGRSGSVTDAVATAPPATVTASAACGPLMSWTIPMMPVRMNVVMSHNCQRFARTPIAVASLAV